MEEHTFQRTAHTGAWSMDVRFVTIEVPKEESCCDGCHTIGCCNAHPHTIRSPYLREDKEERHEEDELAADRHEDALLRHTDALEEITCHDLETHDG